MSDPYLCKARARSWGRNRTISLRCARDFNHGGEHDYRGRPYIAVRAVIRGTVWGATTLAFMFLCILAINALAAFTQG